jgi:hypothetical protein
MEFVMAGSAISHVPPGEYEAIVTKVSLEDKYKRKVLILQFMIDGGEYDGEFVKAFANANYETFSPETKVWKWAETALDREIGVGETIDPEKVFMNRILKVRIDDKNRKDNKMGEQPVISNVTDILGLKCEL